MKKILILLVLCMLIVTACSNDDGNVSTDKKVSLRWKTETKEVTDETKVNEIIGYLKDAGYTQVESDESKGWIYEITYIDDSGKAHKMVIVDEKKLTYDGKTYEGNGVDLSFFDEVSGFDREK